MKLRSLLLRDKKSYEQVSATIPDIQMRHTILTLAQESNQYAAELYSHLQSTGIFSPKEKAETESADDPAEDFGNDQEILLFCKQNEKKMVTAYREILNESHLYEGLRKMIRYQLNGILCSFTQLKLLHSLR